MGNSGVVSRNIMSIVTSLIGLFGCLSGIYLASSLSEDANRQIVQINYQNEILQQRIELLDRAAAIFGKSAGINDIWVLYREAYSELSESTGNLSRDLAEYNAEFNSVIHLSNLYFGPKTRDAIKAMGEPASPWWTKDSDMVADYLAAMASELNHGME